MAAKTKPPLLRLPPELRNCIYLNVLASPEPIFVTNTSAKPDWRSPGLLQTCRQIRDEASPIYFSGNAFRVASHGCSIGAYKVDNHIQERENRTALRKWLQVVGEHTRGLLRRIYLDDHYYYEEDHADRSIAAYRKVISDAGFATRTCALFVEMCPSEGQHRWYADGEYVELEEDSDEDGDFMH